MKKVLTIILSLVMTGGLFSQSWQIVKKSEMDYYPNSGLFFNADSGLWVGDRGSVMITRDGGATMEPIRVAEDESASSWKDVDFFDDKIGFACSKTGGFIYKTVDGGYHWQQVGDTSQFVFDFYSVAVPHPDTIFVAGEEGLLKSFDGGMTWEKVDFTFEVDGKTQKLNGGLDFCNGRVGVVATNANKGATWYTHNAGESWELIRLTFPGGISKKLYDIAAYGDSTITVAGYHHCIFLSNDGGETYNQISDWTSDFVYFSTVQIVNDSTIVAGGLNGYVAMTTNSGTTWKEISLPAKHNVNFLFFVNRELGYVFAQDGHWFKTIDGGNSYIPLLDWPDASFKGLAIIPTNSIIVTAFKGDVTMSTDGGYTWSYPDNQIVGGVNTLYSADFANENLGLVGGYYGDLFRTTDGGATWQAIENPMKDKRKHIYAIRFINDQLVLAAGKSGYVMKSEDGGLTWQQIANESSSNIYDLWAVSENQVLAGAYGGQLLVSSSSLDSFYVKYDYGSMQLREIEFRGEHGVVVGTDGYIFHTTRSNWDTLEQVFVEPGGNDFLATAFVNDTLVYAVGGNGIIYYSTDAGLTWTKDDSVTNATLERLAYGNGKLWAVGEDGYILKKDFEPQVTTENLFINEFMAANDSAIADEQGEFDDWIEIFNDNDFPVDIGGMYITDDLSKPDAYQIPDSLPEQTTIPAKGFLLLWADKEPEQGVLHVGIKLKAAGEQIGLAERFEGQFRFIDSLTFAEQTADISYGRITDGDAEWVFFVKASPGETNANGVIVSLEPEQNQTVAGYQLKQNYPNPFNPRTTIEFSLKKAGNTTLTIYNALGQKVVTVLNKELKSGAYKVKIDASQLASGLYFYELKSGNFRAIRKMLLIK